MHCWRTCVYQRIRLSWYIIKTHDNNEVTISRISYLLGKHATFLWQSKPTDLTPKEDATPSRWDCCFCISAVNSSRGTCVWYRTSYHIYSWKTSVRVSPSHIWSVYSSAGERRCYFYALCTTLTDYYFFPLSENYVIE